MPEITCLHLCCPHCRARVVVLVKERAMTIKETECDCAWNMCDMDDLRRQARLRLPVDPWVERVLHELEQELIMRGVKL